MKAVRLYNTPEEFAEMMVQHLKESLKMSVRRKTEDPLLLEIGIDPNKPDHQVRVSLHDTYRLYRTSGDLNVTIDYLNDVVRTSRYMSGLEEGYQIDPAYLYPAIRDTRYVEEAGEEMPFVSDDYLPGLRQIYLEIKGGCSKIVTHSLLAANPHLTEAEVKRQAYRNLQKGGWQSPRLRLRSPLRSTCTVDVYLEPPFPMECQFLLAELVKNRMPSHYVIAFPNRQCTLVLRSKEPMETMLQAAELVRESGFDSIVHRNVHLYPYPVSGNMFLVRHGKARLLK
ncbi:MAG: hypothetical protein J7639_10580 [Paenibacillaceae bacterium]|nr:hypothetical protein [Paenibacillaceae bacterium]